MSDYVTVGIWRDTRRLLRLIAADSGEQMVEALHRLCVDEARRKGLNVEPSVEHRANDERGTPADTAS